MKNYSVIVFDLGNVLLPFDYTPAYRKMNLLKEGLGERFALKYKENYEIHRKYEKGLIHTEEFLTIMLEWTEGKLLGKEFCRLFSNIFTRNEELISLLPELKKKYRLMLLSNTNDIHKRYGWGGNNFLVNFEKLFLSHEVKALKPEKEIYQTVQNYTQVPAGEHIFVDDIKEYADGAKACGWDAVQFKGNDNLIEEFKQRGII